MKLLHRPKLALAGRGDAASEFRVRITGLALDKTDRLFAAGDREVKVFERGELVDRFETSDAAWSIAIVGEEAWLGMQGVLQRVDLKGRIRQIVDDRDRLGLITGLACGGERLLVADATHRKLQFYDATGAWLREVGAETNTRGFMIPNGVLTAAYDSQGKAFVVAHPQKHRIERYDLEGAPLGRFGKFGNESLADFGGCCNPTTCGTTPSGLILASEKAPPRIKAYTAAGELVAASADDALDPGAKNPFLAADAHGRVYATDSVRGTIEVFELVEE